MGCPLSDSIISEPVFVTHTIKINFLPEGHTCRQFLCCLRKNEFPVACRSRREDAGDKREGPLLSCKNTLLSLVYVRAENIHWK